MSDEFSGIFESIHTGGQLVIMVDKSICNANDFYSLRTAFETAYRRLFGSEIEITSLDIHPNNPMHVVMVLQRKKVVDEIQKQESFMRYLLHKIFGRFY